MRILTGFLVAVLTLSVGAIIGGTSANAQEIKKNVNCGGDKISLGSSTGCGKPSASEGSGEIEDLIKTIINVISAIVGAVAVIMIIIGGFRFVTAGGDSNNVSSAKNTIMYAIVGLVIVAFAQVIVRFVLQRI